MTKDDKSTPREGRKVVHPISETPPGGGSCHHCARALYKAGGKYHYWLFVDDQGIERACHHDCNNNDLEPVGADHPIYDDDEIYRQDLIERKRSSWLK